MPHVKFTRHLHRFFPDLDDVVVEGDIVADDVVYRHALDISGGRLAFGTATGNAYVSDDRGESWHAIGHHFPPIYSVRCAAQP